MGQEKTKFENINKWGIIFFFLASGLGMGGFGIKGYYDKGINMFELEHLKGNINKYIIIDEDKNHKITINIDGQKNTFVFKGVDWFPAIKPILPNARMTEIWVDKDDYNKGGEAKVYQIILDDKPVVLLDDWNKETIVRGKMLMRFGALMTLIGTLLIWIININNSVMSNKLFKIVGTAIFLIASGIQIYLSLSK